MNFNGTPPFSIIMAAIFCFFHFAATVLDAVAVAGWTFFGFVAREQQFLSVVRHSFNWNILCCCNNSNLYGILRAHTRSHRQTQVFVVLTQHKIDWHRHYRRKRTDSQTELIECMFFTCHKKWIIFYFVSIFSDKFQFIYIFQFDFKHHTSHMCVCGCGCAMCVSVKYDSLRPFQYVSVSVSVCAGERDRNGERMSWIEKLHISWKRIFFSFVFAYCLRMDFDWSG